MSARAMMRALGRDEYPLKLSQDHGVVRCDCGRWRDARMPRWDEDTIARANGWVDDFDCPGCGRDLREPAACGRDGAGTDEQDETP